MASNNFLDIKQKNLQSNITQTQKTNCDSLTLNLFSGTCGLDQKTKLTT